MFVNNEGQVRTDVEAIAETIDHLSAGDPETLEEKRCMLRGAIHALSADLDKLSNRDRQAILVPIYAAVTDILFDFHLAVETRCVREGITQAQSRLAKEQLLRQFRSTTERLSKIYHIS